MENRFWYSESFTRILDKYHRPDMFAGGCLPTFSMHFLETNGLSICWQCSATAGSVHFPPPLASQETETPNNLCILPNTTGILLYSTNTIMILKNEIPFNLISSPIANSFELEGTLSENNCSPSVLGSNNVLTMGKWEPGLLDLIEFLQAKFQEQ